MSNFWSWAPAGAGTSNSMYGNFPFYGKSASGTTAVNNNQNGQFVTPTFPQQNGIQPQMTPTFVVPSQNEAVPVQTVPVETPAPPTAPEPISQDPPAAVPQEVVPQATNNSVPVPNDQQNGTEAPATVEYLYGDAAAAYMQQMNIPNDYVYQYQQSQPNQMVTENMNPSNAPTNINFQQIGSGDNSGTGNNAQASDVSKNNNKTNQGDIAEISATYLQTPTIPSYPNVAVQQAANSNTMNPHGQAVPETIKAVGKPRKLQSNQRFVQQVSYEGPPSTKPSPNPKPIDHQGKLTISAKKRLSEKPTFHLCGRCIKCKGIKSNPGIPNMVMFNPLINRGKNTSMGRQVSTTIFTNNM